MYYKITQTWARASLGVKRLVAGVVGSEGKIRYQPQRDATNLIDLSAKRRLNHSRLSNNHGGRPSESGNTKHDGVAGGCEPQYTIMKKKTKDDKGKIISHICGNKPSVFIDTCLQSQG